MADTMTAPTGEMKRSLTLTGVTVNAMALIAPGAFLWTTFQLQAGQAPGRTSTAPTCGLVSSSRSCSRCSPRTATASSRRVYPDAGTGSSYYFAEAALLEKESPDHRKCARFAKLSVGWISHLYYWMYPGIMVAFTATLFGYIYARCSTTR